MIQILSRKHSRSLPETLLSEGVSFVHGRVHELCGPSRRSCAVMLAAQREGPVLWLRPAWHREVVNADGIAPYMNPARITFAEMKNADDIQWCCEEALRSGAAPVIIAEFPSPPALTPIRRLHLAAEESKTPALPLLLSAGDGGAQGIETRWHMAPTHKPEQTVWSLSRLKARLAPPANWSLVKSGHSLLAA